jgi:acetyl esterase/lipase
MLKPNASPRSPLLAPILLLLMMLSACSPLRTFNALIPKDRGVSAVGRDLAFGTDKRQRLDLYRPVASGPQGRLPIILFLYGGSWSSGEKGGYGFAGRALAARGFLVAVPDYRLVPQVRYPAFLEDNAAAVRWVVANATRFGGDPSRVVLVGHSAGAYNAAMLALDPRWLGAERRAIRGWVGLAGPYDFLPLDGPVTRATFGQAGDLGATQPVNFASAGDPATLLLHGTKDTTVLPRNSQRLGALLADKGVSARVKLYPEVGHVGILTAFARPLRGRAPVIDDVTAFAHEVAGR